MARLDRELAISSCDDGSFEEEIGELSYLFCFVGQPLWDVHDESDTNRPTTR